VTSVHPSGAPRPRGRWRVALLALPLLVVAQLANAPAVGAERPLTTGIMDSQFRSQANRGVLLDLTQQAGAGVVRIPLFWSNAATQRPANPRDPSDPAYAFSGIDAAVKAAAQRGFRILLTVRSAPAWAEGPNRPSEHQAPAGTWDPDAKAFGDFGHALARRYSGSFPDPASATGAPLPRVSHYEVWNEGNLTAFLAPQWEGGKPRSPTIYRNLLDAFYDGVHSAGEGNVVIGGALAPYGTDLGGTRMRPLFFLRKLLCLKSRRKLKPKRCPPVKMDAFSHHAISFGSPRSKPHHPDDAPTGQIGRVKRTVRAAEKGGNVKPRGRRPLWVTEFWWPSAPPASPDLRPPFGGVPLQKQARWIEEALYLFWSKSFDTAIYFQIRDPESIFPAGSGAPTGLFFADDAPKPALQAFRFPFVGDRRSKKRVLAWGKSPQAGELVIERQTGGGWQALKTLNVGAGKVFATKLRLRGTAVLRARVGAEQSREWQQRR
jgi:hypothetical protein